MKFDLANGVNAIVSDNSTAFNLSFFCQVLLFKYFQIYQKYIFSLKHLHDFI